MTRSKQVNNDTVNLTLLYHEQANSTLVEDLERYYQQYNEVHQYKYIISNNGKEHCWIVHKPILSQHSPYFAAMFDHEFYESTASIICLPSTILNYYGMNAVIHYMYHSRDFKYWLDRNYHEAGDKLFLLQDTYATADYFGMSGLCIHIIECLNDLVHQWNCQCDDCLYIIPQLYEYTYINTLYQKQQQSSSSSYQKQNNSIDDQQNHEILLNKICSKAIHCLTHDPEKCLPNFWTHRNMARMLDDLSNDNNLMFSRRICKRVTKCNAIESLHACFLATTTLANTDPLLCWSRSLHATLASVQAKSTQLIAKHFNYYCSQYPTLLSCIDGITYSFEFLEYLFMHVLEDQMDTFNAGILYQGIIRDLLCRHSVQYNDQVKHILNVAKDIILQYISNRIDLMKKLAALDNLDTEVLKMLASELDVPIKSLIKSMSKHRGLSQPSLLSILFPPPKISYPNSSASSIHLSRRSSMTTQRTYSLQSNSTSIYSARYYNSNNNNNNGHSSSLIKILKGWIGARDYKQNHHVSTSLSSSSISTSSPVASSSTPNNHKNQNHNKQNKTHPHHPYHKTTIFSWATVTVKFPKKNHGTLYRFFFQHSKLSSQARQKSKMLVVGKRVQLTRRPVLTVGTVKYVGPVLFGEGTWVGVELDRRVGKNDGSVDGERYFTTSPNRGVFVRSDDLKVMF